ncbi:MAG: phosphatidylcholine/phosphatidylserine synthase [Rhodospirillaceae bacterium]|nr:phosphatidylcholine/phosphatidylserine synthase [Rhodospirillaceae bacterium]MBT6406245.1 phosphatidylcholine/phosphatidylserine synthase [Rhodospirillaceae bacterium]
MNTSQRKRRLQHLSINTMIPNILTLLALASGLTGMRFAFQERWDFAVLAIAVAAVFDALDGRIARLLKGASKFGAELDSLSDFVCFGVAPAMILYLWAMQDAGRAGWLLVMLFAMCCGLRLARFNVALDDENEPAWKANFFTGVPAPAGAGLVLLPMILAFQLGDDILRSPWVVSFFLLGVGALFVSSVPTYSFKKMIVPRRRLLATMLTVTMVIAFIASLPWLSLSIILGSYLISMPFSMRAYRRFEAGEEIEVDIDDDDIDDNDTGLEPV